jgi:hypothetical protein
MKVINNFIEPFVERAVNQGSEEVERKEQSGGIVNFADSLSLFTKNKTVLRDQLVNVLLASRDTTAAALSWLFYELAYNPEIYNKLREEVLTTVGSEGMPTYEDMKSMKYLQHCLNEGISLYGRLIKSPSPLSECPI